ncbi:MAG: hypothetical protein R2694_16640 [Ilumatobacteraceae bacterium]
MGAAVVGGAVVGAAVVGAATTGASSCTETDRDQRMKLRRATARTRMVIVAPAGSSVSTADGV